MVMGEHFVHEFDRLFTEMNFLFYDFYFSYVLFFLLNVTYVSAWIFFRSSTILRVNLDEKCNNLIWNGSRLFFVRFLWTAEIANSRYSLDQKKAESSCLQHRESRNNRKCNTVCEVRSTNREGHICSCPCVVVCSISFRLSCSITGVLYWWTVSFPK